MTEKSVELIRSHVAWVLEVVVLEESPNPADIRFFGSNRVMAGSDLRTHAVE